MAVPAEMRDELADSLYTALQTASPIDRLTANHELTISDAYDVQTRLIDHRLDDGAEVTGHKIGLTSEGIQNQLDVDEPDFGRLLDTMFVDGRVVPAAELIAPRVEPEVGFLMSDSLEPPVTYIDVLHATASVLPIIEVIDSRVRDWDIRIEDTIADNASSACYLTGERTTVTDGLDLSLEGVKLHKNGTVAEHGVGAAVLDHPARSVAWLANTLDELDERIEAGELILSGSLTPAVDVKPGDVLTAEFASLGSISARIGE
ncbi:MULTISPECIES: fumarylacetoacetate hydrolase family protein [unclassified Haladaptatus]|uniref:2-keto-4-pentenoate hydratase n=1 Tax=unclassified Haladaptatus TaxID=2622732 RepID=UPI00209C07A9|nr:MULTISPECIES: fumarylacetoacetate hydrolase family protein [unclassified Haladaptatus]MCO8243653.1 2-oxopent-4-enoate hydratase [Haladaptatus sp. AB643]MCO8255062.1 2-oxopent-4-enoate hydratase [Haladaptatus sp. AB618]